ncbi:outer membrane lipoprotein chaperone LolA [Psychromonas sp. SR45-3]|uniref:outer membrane lipoprotein chaperone LolA n=1 Tax=Psychromonas sp. SR45-3 TaxID=2760930 RepID=UPI0015FB743A|nr:outer membrane lipoprotein chaperone LolA [Psychromonas sp. SR45-3]MBB1273581.1 outer membrane lipoprotein chaperone LolA [Psychromonas sp. SR45-3]
MKKILFITVCLISSMFQFASAQTDSELLQQKLAKFTTIDADFVQQVINPKGEVIQKSWGTLAIARPGNFHWQVTQPDEELIVSNGQDMWLYSPFIEQVTIMNFSDAIAGTPFALLSGADSAQWAQFNVVKKDQQFIVKSSDPKASTNTFIFIFNKAGNISEFVVQESQGQKSVFTLSNNKNNSTFAKDFFEFKIPNGIEIDDQR